MALFQKKTNIVHNITYMAIMTAINLIFILLDRFLPFLTVLLILLLPFASAVVSYYCLKRYYIIYAIANIGLCFIFIESLFYVVPAICTGFVIGLLLDKKVHPFWMLLSSVVIEAVLAFAFIPLINLMTGSDLIKTTFELFRLKDFAYKPHLMYLAILFVAFAQCTLTHFIMLSEIKKIGIETNTCVDSFGPYILGLLTTLIVALIFALTYSPLSLAFVALSFYFAIFLLFDIALCKKPLVYVCLGFLLTVAFFLFVIFYTKIEKPLGFVLVSLFSLAVSITSFVNNYLLKARNNI